MKWQERTLSQVIANRTAARQKPMVRHYQSRTRMEEESGEAFLKKVELGDEDKLEALRYLERKCRLSFSQAFGGQHLEWLVAKKESIIVHKEYDPVRKSYYLFGGKAKIVIPKPATLLTQHLQDQQNKEQTVYVQGQVGFGWLFGQQSYSRAHITLISGTMLSISHPHSLTKFIQRNCLMTMREKQQAISKIKLFSPIQNLSKTHLPYFTARKCIKGEYIYLIGDPSTHFYLIIEGVVAFQSEIRMQTQSQALPLLRRSVPVKNGGTMLVTTETISKNNYFGEEEMLSQTTRKQNARCLSIECILLVIPEERIQRLMTSPQFKRSLQLSATLKEEAREHQINTYISLSNKKQQPALPTPQDTEKFNQIKSTIYTQLCPPKQQRLFHNRFVKDRKKVIHNHSLTVPEILTTPVRISDFSMLNVNKAMYQKTLMRFRYNLKELQKDSQQKQNHSRNGRSLSDIWRTLKLQKSFNPEQQRLKIENEDGMTYYNAHQRIVKHIRDTKCLRPKFLNCSNKLKTEYIEYLQMAL